MGDNRNRDLGIMSPLKGHSTCAAEAYFMPPDQGLCRLLVLLRDVTFWPVLEAPVTFCDTNYCSITDSNYCPIDETRRPTQ